MVAPVRVALDKRDVARAQKMLARYHGKPVRDRLSKGTLKAGDLVKRSLQRKYIPKRKKANYPGPFARYTEVGLLRKMVWVRRARVSGAFGIGGYTVLDAEIVSGAPHAHLIHDGTRAHSLARKRPGKSDFVKPGFLPPGRAIPADKVYVSGVKAVPYMEQAAQGELPAALRIVSEALFART